MHKIYKLNSIFKATSKTRAVCISWVFWAHHHYVLFHEYELTEIVYQCIDYTPQKPRQP